MLIFATSDKGGTGRSVTSCNVAYRRALSGDQVAYLDFDFGSPTAGAIFDIQKAERGADGGGLHSYFTSGTEPLQLNVAQHSERTSLQKLTQSPGAGRLVLLPGDKGGGEFSTVDDMTAACAELFLRLDSEFDLCIVDLSAGRSYAVELALQATARPELKHLVSRWLVYHRWTRQNIIAAEGLVRGDKGLLDAGRDRGHDPKVLHDSLRYVRTAVVDLSVQQQSVERAPQEQWLREYDKRLHELADRLGLGRARLAGQVPFDPVLQWCEQVIADPDVSVRKIANQATIDAYDALAGQLSNEDFWEGL